MLAGEEMAQRCPHCDRPFGGFRFGLRFGELAVRIIDAVKRAGVDGIEPDVLFELIYADRPSKRTALKGYVESINRRLADVSDVRISARGGAYRIARARK